MNDRGARLTPVDLLKSYLLANVGEGQEKLNDRWRRMLAELTSTRDDHGATSRFVKAALQARYARVDGGHDDMGEIGRALNLWVRRNENYLGLTRTDRFHSFVDHLLELATLHRTFLHASGSAVPPPGSAECWAVKWRGRSTTPSSWTVSGYEERIGIRSSTCWLASRRSCRKAVGAGVTSPNT
ncbi:hypothetical protein GCM10010466_24500 [Planomonospora alba]|uniref:Uncharacterized protein n=1 Tax=Planomonospora alba TaxID=161354 RepID=A0ABP6N2Q2_9ACTN